MFMPASTILFAILLENMLHDIRKQVCTYFFSSPRFHRSYTYSIDILELFYCPFTVPILRFVYTTYAAKYPEKAANPGNVRSWGKYFSIHDSLPTEIHNESQCFHSVRHIPGKSQNPVAQLNPSSPRICLTACQRFLLLSILICSVNNETARGGFAAASLQRRGGTKIVVTPSAQEQW